MDGSHRLNGPGLLWRQQVSHPHQVVSRGHEVSCQPGSIHSPIPGPPKSSHRLHPPEYLLHPLANLLAHPVARMPRGPYRRRRWSRGRAQRVEMPGGFSGVITSRTCPGQQVSRGQEGSPAWTGIDRRYRRSRESAFMHCPEGNCMEVSPRLLHPVRCIKGPTRAGRLEIRQ